MPGSASWLKARLSNRRRSDVGVGIESGEAGNPEWITLEEGLKSVLEKLWSRRELITQYNSASRKIWWCGQFQTGFNSGAMLPASLLAELAEFGADLFIDSYMQLTPPP